MTGRGRDVLVGQQAEEAQPGIIMVVPGIGTRRKTAGNQMRMAGIRLGHRITPLSCSAPNTADYDSFAIYRSVGRAGVLRKDRFAARGAAISGDPARVVRSEKGVAVWWRRLCPGGYPAAKPTRAGSLPASRCHAASRMY